MKKGRKIRRKKSRTFELREGYASYYSSDQILGKLEGNSPVLKCYVAEGRLTHYSLRLCSVAHTL